MKKKLPIGRSNFRDLMNNDCYYVDKTLFVKEICDSGAKVTLITRPRRFGKTLNMQMLKAFFDIQEDNTDIFRGLNIMSTEYANLINTVPVVYLSFANCKGDKVEMLTMLKEEVLREYLRYGLLEETLADKTLEKYKSINKALNDTAVDTSVISSSIKFLCEIVCKHYKTPPILLIDEYDTPIIAALGSKALNFSYEPYFNEVRSFFTLLYGSALKDNDLNIRFAVLTGITRAAKENIFSSLNNLIVCTVDMDIYADKFGFTEEETRLLLESYGYTLDYDVKQMYNGYSFGSAQIYNPWSILNYAFTGQLDLFWINTGSNTFIKDIILNADTSFHDEFETLFKDGKITARYDVHTTFADFENNSEAIWGLLLNSGYVTISEKKTGIGTKAVLKIPNKEVKSDFIKIFADYTNINKSSLEKMFDCLMDSDIKGFIEIYQKIVISVTSYHDDAENAYHMLFLGMSVYLDGLYEIKSNREHGFGRSDVALISKDKKHINMILEFKHLKGVNDEKTYEKLSELAEKALCQIIDKKYYEGIEGKILLMGVAHSGKLCHIASDVLDNG